MMRCYLGSGGDADWTRVVDLIIKGMEGAISAKTVTYDIHRMMGGDQAQVQ